MESQGAKDGEEWGTLGKNNADQNMPRGGDGRSMGMEDLGS